MYSNTLLEEMDEDGNFALTPKLGTTILGLASLTGAVLSPVAQIFLGRK